MTGPDDEFDDFLARRKPLFRRPEDDPLEPPRGTRPHRAAPGARGHRSRAAAARHTTARAGACPWRSPRPCWWCSPWSCTSASGTTEPVPEVTVQTVAQQIDYPAAAPDRSRRHPEVADDVAPRSDARDRAGASPGARNRSRSRPLFAARLRRRRCVAGARPTRPADSRRRVRRTPWSRSRGRPRPRRPGGAIRAPGWRKSNGCAPRARPPRPMPNWPSTSASTGRTREPPTDSQPRRRGRHRAC